MKRKDFLRNALSSSVFIGCGSYIAAGCKAFEQVNILNAANTDLITLPKQFRIFQFYQAFTVRDLAALGQSKEIFYKKHVRLEYDAIRKISNRISSLEKDGAKHPDVIDVKSLFKNERGETEVSPFLNHRNPNSHLIYFNKEDLADLILHGKTIYLATGFHQKDHFHIAMIKPTFAQGDSFEVPKSELDIPKTVESSAATLPSNDGDSDGDSDGDGVENSEDLCPNSIPGKKVWNKNNHEKGTAKYDTAAKYHGCHGGQTPQNK
jgi:hypothetical protein